MNITEAIKSGMPFRRRLYANTTSGCYFWSLNRDTNCAKLDPQRITFSVDDLLADDWEIQEPRVEITRREFWSKADEVLPEIKGNDLNFTIRSQFGRLANLLGLGPD